jgi:hypothetical protein
MLNKPIKNVGLGLLLLIVAILAFVGQASANPNLDGVALYASNCANADCHHHQPLPNSDKLGANASDIQNAISTEPAMMGMSSLSSLSQAQIQAIADVLATSATSDIIAPTTNISGVAENGSFDNNVTITLTAEDNAGGSGVNQTLYTVNGGETSIYAEPFTVNTVGQDNVKYWSTDNAGNTESEKMVNFTVVTNVTRLTPFEFTVAPQSISVKPAENAVYNLNISNTGNFADTYDLAIANPSDANVVFSVDNVAVNSVFIEPLQSANIAMNVNIAVTGTFLVNVTATSQADTNNSMTVYTSTIVGGAPITPGVNAMREIDSKYLGPGESTNVTVNVSSDVKQALVLQETIPEGWNLTRISDDADSFRSNGVNEWLWINMTSGENKTVVYKLTAPNNASMGNYSISGSVVNSTGVVAIVGGSNTVSISIIGYYRKLGDDPNKIDTSDVLEAIEDWRGGIARDGFANPITSEDLTTMLDAWAKRE